MQSNKIIWYITHLIFVDYTQTSYIQVHWQMARCIVLIFSYTKIPYRLCVSILKFEEIIKVK